MSKTADMIPTAWTTLWSDALNTGTWRSAIPVYQHRPSPCHLACPVNGVIPSWIDGIRKGRPHEAWLKVVANNPFPSITGRVCHHPCEIYCNRKEYDERVSIKSLERYLGDLALEKGWTFPAAHTTRKERVAIIGGGPAGLSAAYQLRLRGFGVEIFETRRKPGGLLRYGIPDYRLPSGVLDQELERLWQLGIRLHTDTAINTPDEYNRLQNEYDALFISTGAQRSRKLSQFENNSDPVLDGLDFLYRVNSGLIPKLGQKVLVIGGGNTAIDAARSAKRLGADQVTLVYRRTEEEMPSQKGEILEAREEGILFSFLASPIRIEKENGVQKLLCQKIRLGEADATGRPRPEPIEGAFFALELDNMIMALGSDIVMPEVGDGLEVQGSILKVDEEQQTSAKGIFAGGGSLFDDGGVSPEVVSFKEINTFYFSQKPAAKNNLLQASDRIHNFREVQQGISERQALDEAARCFNCGLCTTCDNCYYFCPDMAIKRNDSAEEESYTILEQYCKGCGLCVKECPRAAIVLKEESK